MITIEKNVTNIGDAIDMIIGEVFGFRSEFAESVQKFIHYKNPSPQYINNTILCEYNNTFGNTSNIGTVTTNSSESTIGKDDINSSLSSLSIENTEYHGIVSYKDFVEYALFTIGNNIPSPLRLGNPYNLTIGNNFTAIRYSNNTSVSIKVFTNKDSIKYSINITFHSTPVCDPYIKESDEYKSAIKNGWKVKEDFNKPIKKNI